MITSAEAARWVGSRVVLRSESNVSYAGILTSIETLHGKPGVLLELDEHSGFSIWCPVTFVKELLVVPI